MEVSELKGGGTAVGGRRVRGDLLRWARNQRGLSLRHVKTLGGPSIAFQCEIENHKKTEVSTKVLERWVEVLGVTVDFAQGRVPRFVGEEQACRGFLREVAAKIRAGEPEAPDWPRLSATERVRRVLRLAVAELGSDLGLAHLLGLDIQALQAMMAGQVLIQPEMLHTVAHVSTLPLDFLKRGVRQNDEETPLAAFREGIRLALQKQITPSELQWVISQWEKLPADLRRPPAGDSPTHRL